MEGSGVWFWVACLVVWYLLSVCPLPDILNLIKRGCPETRFVLVNVNIGPLIEDSERKSNSTKWQLGRRMGTVLFHVTPEEWP
jgi:hypothetical protein